MKIAMSTPLILRTSPSSPFLHKCLLCDFDDYHPRVVAIRAETSRLTQSWEKLGKCNAPLAPPSRCIGKSDDSMATFAKSKGCDTVTPSVEWGQSRDTVTIDFVVAGARDVAVLVAQDMRTIAFQCTSGALDPVECTLRLYRPALDSSVQPVVLARAVRIVLNKVVGVEWPRLTEEPTKALRHLVSYNWDIHRDDFDQPAASASSSETDDERDAVPQIPAARRGETGTAAGKAHAVESPTGSPRGNTVAELPARKIRQRPRVYAAAEVVLIAVMAALSAFSLAVVLCKLRFI